MKLSPRAKLIANLVPLAVFGFFVFTPPGHALFGKAVAFGLRKNYIWTIRNAAENGGDWHQYQLAWCYATGYCVEMNQTEAVKWYRMAAEQNYPQAQLELGNRYLDGNGVAKDYVEAFA